MCEEEGFQSSQLVTSHQKRPLQFQFQVGKSERLVDTWDLYELLCHQKHPP